MVVSFRLWVRWVGLWHSRWTSLPRDPKKGVGGVIDSSDRVPKTSQRLERQSLERQSLKKSTQPGQPKAVGRVKASGNLYTMSCRPGLSSETGQVKVSGAQSTWPVQCGRTSEGFWKSSQTGLSHPAREDKRSLLVKPRNPPDTVGNAEVAQFTVLQVTAGPKRPAAQEVVFQPTGLRDLEGVPSLTEVHRAVRT